MTRVAAGQELGDREAQEDAVQIAPQGDAGDHLLILADGMGGHAGGQVASNLAVQTFQHHFEEVSDNLRPSGRLHEALLEANDAIAEETLSNPELSRMGCTLLAVLVAAGRIAWISVGDSVLFLIRGGRIERLSADHSYFGELMEMVARGELTEAEARAHPRKNALRSVVNGETLTLIDNKVLSLEEGDILLLASDGLETLPDNEIVEIALSAQMDGVDAIKDALLDAVVARNRPKQDNTSLIVWAHGAPKPIAREVSAVAVSSAAPPAKNPLLMPGLIAVAAIAGLLLLVLAFSGAEPDPAAPPLDMAQPGSLLPEGASPIGEEPVSGGSRVLTPRTGEITDGSTGTDIPSGGDEEETPEDPVDGGSADGADVDTGPVEETIPSTGEEGTNEGADEDDSATDADAAQDTPEAEVEDTPEEQPSASPDDADPAIAPQAASSATASEQAE